jgi:HSP20 family protein
MESKEIVPSKEKGPNQIEELLETQNYILPLVNIHENDNEFILSANMPGVARKDVKVKLENNSLIMFGQIDYENEISKSYILNEHKIGNFFRTFKISDTVDQSNIEAKYDNGQLVIKLPKIEKVRPRTIDIL